MRLCIFLVQDEPEYMEMLKGRGQIVRNDYGKWIPTETWSSKYSIPVITKLHE